VKLAGFSPQDFFVLRVPFGSVEEGVQVATVDGLKTFFASEITRAALSFASINARSFFERGEVTDSKLAATLHRYARRMTHRSTPFGLLAAVSLGRRGATSNLGLGSRADSSVHLEASGVVVGAGAKTLAANPVWRARLHYRPNPMVVRLGSRLRFLVATPPVDDDYGFGDYQLRDCERSEALDLVLAVGHDSTLDSLASQLVEAGLADDRSEALAFLDMLVEEQLLLRSTDAAPVGPMARPLEAAFAGVGRAPPVLETVRAVQSRSPFRLGDAHRVLIEVEAATSQSAAAVVHATTWRPAPDFTLSPLALREIARGGELLARVGGVGLQPQLEKFREAFRNRYEDAEVPLLEAVDPELGAGKFLTVELPPPEVGERQLARTTRLMEIRDAALEERRPFVELDDADLAVLDSRITLPRTAAVTATLFAPSSGDVDRGRFDLEIAAVTSDPASILGRFASSSDDLTSELRAMLLREEAGDEVFAEIVHAPGNMKHLSITNRPSLRVAHVMLFGGRSGEVEGELPLSDLALRLGWDGRFILRRRSDGRRVQLRLSNAHNFMFGRNFPLYRALAYLAYEREVRGSWFTWGQPLERMRFLPRVRHKRFILSRARWFLSDRVRGKDGIVRHNDAALRADLEARVSRGALPRLVGVSRRGEEDPLALDIGTELGMAEFVRQLRRATALGAAGLRVIESVPSDLGSPVRGEEGSYHHEILLPVAGTAPATPPPHSRVSPGPPVRHPPGGEWLYLKIYGAEELLEQLLLERLAPFLTKFRAKSPGERDWFFVRYTDPEPHLRLRLWAPRPEALRSAEHSLNRILRSAEELRPWRWAVDTYIAEPTRYGGEVALACAERMFGADSRAAVAMLATAGEIPRVLLMTASASLLIQDFGIAAGEAKRLCREQADLRARLLQKSSRRVAVSSELFSRHRDVVLALVRGQTPDLLCAVMPALHERSKENLRLVEPLRRAAGERSISDHEILVSLLHMSANRIFPRSGHKDEPAALDLLARAWAAELALVNKHEP
jgi:thiopeptide-type bacteriocin biosynthesis protein